MFNLFMSAFLGVLVGKVVDIFESSKKKQNSIYLFMGIMCVFVAYFFIQEERLDNPSCVYVEFKKIIDGWDSNILIQSVFFFFVLVGITITNIYRSGFLTFKQYSKRIYDFTLRAHEGSTVTLIAGDMDFLGGIKVEQEKVPLLMEESKEYIQLLQLGDRIKLKILCNHKLEEKVANAIIEDTISPKFFYNDYRIGGNLGCSSFQQLLRIGKIKSDLGRSVEIRFYNSENDDTRFRARFVDDEGIVYKKETEKVKFRLLEMIKTLIGNPLKLKERIQKITHREDLYSIHYLNKQEYVYYYDMFKIKWDLYDSVKCDKIVNFCESLYHFVNRDEKKYHMALIYVNSYEIARKGKRRKEFPPFGVLYLAASVNEEPGWKVDIKAIDENNYKLNLLEYDVVGFSIVSSYSYAYLKKCNDTSDMKDDVLKIAGGYQAEKFWHEVFRDFETDLIFKGEGENSIRQMCKQYRTRNFSAIDGVIYKDNRGGIAQTEGRGNVDIDKIPEPARYLLPIQDVVMKDRLAGTEKSMVHMLFSRGCPNDCIYCAANQNGNNKCIRYRDKQLIVKELLNLKSAYNIDGFSIIDDCFLMNKKEAIEICKFIAESNLGLVWSLAARVDNVDDEILEVLQKAGCIEIKFGIETGSNDLLLKMQKGITIEMAEKVIQKTKAHGIGVKLFIITGLPEENEKDHIETIRFLEKMKKEGIVDRVSLLRYTPLAGSYIYDHPENYGINSQELKTDNFDKMYLYERSYNWWNDERRLMICDKWYNEIQTLIDKNWGDS